MAVARGAQAGGIGGLLELIRQHGEALDAAIRHEYPGHRLADVVSGRLTLRELRTLLNGLPHDGHALWRSVRDQPGTGRAKPPPDSWWTPDRDFAATTIDLLNTLVWMQSDDARKGRNRPKPIERPGVSRGRRMGKTSLPQEQVRAVLAARGPQRRPQLKQDSSGRWRDQRGRFARREPADG